MLADATKKVELQFRCKSGLGGFNKLRAALGCLFADGSRQGNLVQGLMTRLGSAATPAACTCSFQAGAAAMVVISWW